MSKSNGVIEDNQLEHILVHSGIFNKINSITGMLIYSEGHFLQLLEGNREDVNNLWEALQKDTRHVEIKKISEGIIEERYFQDWTMGYKSPNYMELLPIQGYRNPNDIFHYRTSSVHILLRILSEHNEQEASIYRKILV